MWTWLDSPLYTPLCGMIIGIGQIDGRQRWLVVSDVNGDLCVQAILSQDLGDQSVASKSDIKNLVERLKISFSTNRPAALAPAFEWLEYKTLQAVKMLTPSLYDIYWTLLEGADTHYPNEWKDQGLEVHLKHASDHLEAVLTKVSSDDKEDHLAHSACRLMMALALRNLAS